MISVALADRRFRATIDAVDLRLPRFAFALWWAAAVAAMTMLIGCSGQPYQVAPTHGRVTVDGIPLNQGKVMLTPIAKGKDLRAGRIALGRINEQGDFKLSTYSDGDGAIVGDHWATVINVEEKLPKGIPEFARLMFPEKVSVKADQENQIDLEFTKAMVKKYREDDR
jgi:hypothetical protein